jgi:transcription initiation factor IIE alpha subunit
VTSQFDLFASPPSRRISTPIAYQDTSGEAWAAIQEVRGKIDKEIIATLRMHGPLTDEQIERATGIKHQTVSANRRHLVERRVVMESGLFDETGKTRKIRWTLTSAYIKQWLSK